jgi:hypothetical protein
MEILKSLTVIVLVILGLLLSADALVRYARNIHGGLREVPPYVDCRKDERQTQEAG